jgi:PPOX class probable F420-dependent enzyme
MPVATDDEIRTHAAAAPVARLATIGQSGAVDLVPITFSWLATTLVTAVDHKPKRTRQLRRLDNIARDARVTVLIDHYTDDWSALWWVRLRGSAAIVNDGPRFTDAITRLVAKYPRQYGPHPPEGPVIEIAVTDVRVWRAS